jgi:hypothetical protein
MQFSQELQNRMKDLLRKNGRCVIETMEDKTIKVRAYPRKVKKVPPLPSEEGGSGGRAWRNSKPGRKSIEVKK